MRLVMFSEDGLAQIGALTDGPGIIPLRRVDNSIPEDIIGVLSAGADAFAKCDRAIKDAEEAIARDRSDALSLRLYIPLEEAVLEAPIQNPRTVLGIGLNYRDHAKEAGLPLPERPVVFTKIPSCITGPGKPIYRPAMSDKVDWEAELCFVVGHHARNVRAAEAFDYVAGYTIGNDVSVRDWQAHSPTLMMGKSFETHGPIGPSLVTPDEVDVRDLEIKTFVNGVLKQHSSTSQLVFGIPSIIEYITTAFALEPGDIIFTGTPAGVGGMRNPPEFLKDGDVVRVEIAGLGVLENAVVDEAKLATAQAVGGTADRFAVPPSRHVAREPKG